MALTAVQSDWPLGPGIFSRLVVSTKVLPARAAMISLGQATNLAKLPQAKQSLIRGRDETSTALCTTLFYQAETKETSVQNFQHATYESATPKIRVSRK